MKRITYNKIKLLPALLALLPVFAATAQNHWTPDTDPFEDYMTITGYVVMNGFELEGERYEVGCFIDDDCRASYRFQQMPYQGHNYPCFLSIWGSGADNGKAITLKVYDHETQNEYEINEKPLYQYGEGTGVDLYEFTITNAPFYEVVIDPTSNGTVETNKALVFEDETVTLTITPAEGYELDVISACKTGETATTVTLSGTGNTRTFIMPGYGVTITATFKKTQATLDKEAVEEAKEAIELANIYVMQEEANTKIEIETWVIAKINSILSDLGTTPTPAPFLAPGRGNTVTVDDIVVSNFVAAVEGDENNPDGTNGGFMITVSLSKGASNDTATVEGTIIASPYTPFDIVIADTENGTVTSDRLTAGKGLQVTLTITPAEDYELDAISACKTGDTATTVTIDGTGNTRTFVMPAHEVTVSATFKKTQAVLDEEAVAAAKEAIELSSYNLMQVEANVESAVRTWLVARINPLIAEFGISITSNQITISNFSAAIAGTESNPDGTNGSFKFSVPVKRGNAQATASKSDNIIIATSYLPPVTYPVTIEGAENGTVTSDKEAAAAGVTVTLTIAPAEGYELEVISAYKTGDTATVITISGNGNIRTFVMPAHEVTVTAAFKKTQATLDKEAVAAAKEIIDAIPASYFIIKQEEGNSEPEVKQWLAEQINPLIEEFGIILNATDITFDYFTAAIAGTQADPAGTDGNFDFTVALALGEASDSTGTLSGTITATPYGSAIDQVEQQKLRASSVDGGILIRGLARGETLHVYNVQGQLLYQGITQSEEQYIALPSGGVYIVITSHYRIKTRY